MDRERLGGDPEELLEETAGAVEEELPVLPDEAADEEAPASLEDETVERISGLESGVVTFDTVAEEESSEDTAEEDSESSELSAETLPYDGEDSPAEPEEPEEPAEPCALCGEKPADKSFGPDYDLCADCRKKLIRTPVKFSGLITFIVMLALVLVGGYLSVLGQAGTYANVADAMQASQDKKCYSVINSLQQTSGMGWKSASLLVKACDLSGYMSPLQDVIGTYFYDKNASEDVTPLTWEDKVGKSDLNAPWNKEVREIYDSYKEISAAYEKYYKIFSEYDEKLYYSEITASDVPYDDIYAQLEAERTKTEDKAELSMIGYMENYIANMCDRSEEEQIAALEICRDETPEYTWLYLNNLTETYILAGEYDKAEECCKQIEERNAEDKFDEFYRAKIANGKKDYDKAIELLEGIIKDYEDNGFYYAFYEAAVNYALKGDLEKAKEYLTRCVIQQEDVTYNSVNLYALVCKELKDNDGYKAAESLLNQNYYEISPTLDKYFKGKLTLEEIFSQKQPFEVEKTVTENTDKTQEAE